MAAPTRPGLQRRLVALASLLAAALAAPSAAASRAWTDANLRAFLDQLVSAPTTSRNHDMRTDYLVGLVEYTVDVAPDLRGSQTIPDSGSPAEFVHNFRFDRIAPPEDLAQRLAVRDLIAGLLVCWHLSTERPEVLLRVRAPAVLYQRAARALGAARIRNKEDFRLRAVLFAALEASGELDAAWVAPARDDLEDVLRRPKWWFEDPALLDRACQALAEAAGAPPQAPVLPPAALVAAGLVLLASLGVLAWRRRSTAATAPTTPTASAGPGARGQTTKVPVGEGAARPLGTDAMRDQLPARYANPSLLGQGGMGVVFEAQDTLLCRKVAVKVLALGQPGGEPGGEACQRFLREARVLAALDHPGILRIHDVSVEPFPFFTMEFLEGEALEDYGRRAGPLGAAEASGLVAGALDALQYAHGKGVVHRDLKPDNIQRLPDGSTKLIDFGLAISDDLKVRITGIGKIPGTPAFVSPEQLRGDPATPRSDVYSMGVVLYWLLTQAFPIESTQVFSKVFNVPRPLRDHRDDLSPELERVVLTALDLDPALRFGGAEEFADALRMVGGAEAS